MTAEIIDAAQDYIDKFTQAGVDRCRINHNAVSATHCCDCGDPIPARRREAVAGCQHCADCQEESEVRGKHTKEHIQN